MDRANISAPPSPSPVWQNFPAKTGLHTTKKRRKYKIVRRYMGMTARIKNANKVKNQSYIYIYIDIQNMYGIQPRPGVNNPPPLCTGGGLTLGLRWMRGRAIIFSNIFE